MAVRGGTDGGVRFFRRLAAPGQPSIAYAAPGDSVTVYGYGFYPGGDVVVGIDLRRTSPGLQIRPMPTPAAVGTVSLPGAPAQATNTPAPAGAQHGFGYRYISVWYHTVHASRHSVAHFTLAR